MKLSLYFHVKDPCSYENERLCIKPIVYLKHFFLLHIKFDTFYFIHEVKTRFRAYNTRIKVINIERYLMKTAQFSNIYQAEKELQLYTSDIFSNILININQK